MKSEGEARVSHLVLFCELLYLPASLEHLLVGMRVKLEEFFALDVEPPLTEQEGQRHEQKA